MISLETAYIASGCVSMTVVSTLVLTFLIFPYKIQEYARFAGPTCVCWFVANLSWTFGFPPNNSMLCKVQAPLFIYFFFAADIWFSMLSFHFFSIWVLNKPFNAGLVANVIGWGMPCVPCFIPLARLPYGRGDGLVNLGPCNFKAVSALEYTQWIGPFLLVVLILSTTLGMAFIATVYLKYHQIGKFVSIFLVIPTMTIALWTPFCVVAFIIWFHPTDDINYARLALWLLLLAFQVGNAAVIAFYAYSPEFRRMWFQLIVERKLEQPPNFNPSSGINSGSGTEHCFGVRSSLLLDTETDAQYEPLGTSPEL